MSGRHLWKSVVNVYCPFRAISWAKNSADQSRITSIGHGLSKPIAGNDTKEGRALNRRAELIPVK